MTTTIRLWLSQDTRSAEGIDALLAALADVGWTPTHASHDEYGRMPFSPRELTTVALRQTFDGVGWFLFRRATPGWEGYLELSRERPALLELVVDGDDPETFASLRAIAGALAPVYGWALRHTGDPTWDRLPLTEDPLRNGIRALWPWTFFGRGLARRLDRAALTGVVVRERPTGVEVTLTGEPWASPREVLEAVSDAASPGLGELRDSGERRPFGWWR